MPQLFTPHNTSDFLLLTVFCPLPSFFSQEQQLLSRVVQMERPELEEQKKKLVEEVNHNKKLLKGLEDDLLYRLANSTGNLLDDVELIEVLPCTGLPRPRTQHTCITLRCLLHDLITD